MIKVERKEKPPYFADYHRYKPFLRKDFKWRCAYCTKHEAEGGGHPLFEIDHFRPRNRFPHLISEYPNLYYACRRCNSYKGGVWPTSEEQREGLRFVDPCADDPKEHFEIQYRGLLRVSVKSLAGSYTVGCLRLHKRSDIRWLYENRWKQRRTLRKLKKMLRQLMELSASKFIEGQERTELFNIKAYFEKEILEFSKAVSLERAPPY